MSVSSVGQSVNVQQIMQVVENQLAAERDKISLLRDEKSALEDKQLAFSNVDRIMEELESVLQSLAKESTFSSRVATSSNPDLVTASASNGAPKTSFTFSSITQLATAASVTSSGSLGLSLGSAPYRTSTADINGAGDDYNPNLAISTAQNGINITAGTFSINGVEIEVETSDTMFNVLTKINNAGAGVVATFDAAADTVSISGTTIGAGETITVEAGTSNFLSETNILDAGAETAGEDKEVDKNLNEVSVSGFGVVTDGYFNINNFTFIVNTAEDSINDIIGRVNNSNVGATMFYDPDTNKVTITNQEEGDPLILSNDTSHFLDALDVVNRTGDQDTAAETSMYLGQKAQFTLNGETIEKTTNTFKISDVTFTLTGTTDAQNPSARVTITPNHESTVETVGKYVTQFNATLSVLEDKVNEEGGPLEGDKVLKALLTSLRTNTLKKFDNPGVYDTLVDIGINFERQAGNSFRLTLDEDTLKSSLTDDETSVRELFAFNNDSDGLLDDGGYAVTTRETFRTYTRSISGFFAKRNDNIFDMIDDKKLEIYDKEQDYEDEFNRLFDETAKSVQILQALQLQAQHLSQISSITLGMITQ